MICELCGKDMPHLKAAVVEGTTMNICTGCFKFADGDLTAVMRAAKQTDTRSRVGGFRTGAKKDGGLERQEMELILDYPKAIRSARAKLELSQEDLAKKINEKKSVITRLETGHIKPNNELIKKLERALNIKLKEKIGGYAVQAQKSRSMKLTLGDLIKKEE